MRANGVRVRALPTGVAAALLSTVLVTGLTSGHASAATLLPGFSEVRLASGLNNVTTMTVAPDGRIFVSEQAGRLRVIKEDVLLATPALTLTVDSTNERGLLGVAFDPDFASNGFIYVYYTSPAPVAHNRLSRFTLAGDVVVAGSEVTLMDLPALGLAPIHNGGAVHIGVDGKLWVSVGENFNGPNAQNLNTTLGKLLRINRDGSIPTDNPFYSQLTGDNRAIWALGLRNPYTFAIQPTTGRILVNDVGDKLFDEINDIVKGGNYGWPETEGPHDDPRFEPPFYSQAWNPRDCTLIGAAFYNPAARDFPVGFVGKYFFADLCGGYVKVLDLATRQAEMFATGLATPVDLDVSADGKLYYLNRGSGTGTGEVWRVFHGHDAPTIAAQPEGQLVSSGELASFSCAGSGAAPLAYQWQRDGADVPGATGTQLSFVTALSDDGASFRCLVRNEFGQATSNPAVLRVTANRTPVARIDTPVEGTRYAAGTTLLFSGDAEDPEDGVLPASAFTWEVVFDHDDHTHPGIVLTGVKNGSYDIATIGESSANVKYRIILRVKDKDGLQRVVQRDVRPKLTAITVTSNHPGRTVRLDGVPLVTPFSRDGVVGIVRTLDAPLFQQEREASPVWFEFQSWSDGGAASHPISLPIHPTTYKVYYKRIENPACIPFPALSRFVNMPFANQTGSFTADFDVTPTAFPVNANVALSDGPRGGLPGQAALVAFNTAGRVLVRDVTAARSDVVFNYEGSKSYHVRMGVNLVDHRYSVWITPPGGAEVALASNYGFRVEHAFITQLNNWGAFVSPNASGGTVQVCNFELNCGGDKNTPPTLKAPRDLVLRTERGATACGRVVTDAQLGQPRVRDNCGRVAIARTGVPAGNLFPVGTTVVTWTATDAGGQVATAQQKVTVIDETPPVIAGLTATPNVLSPPDGTLRDVRIDYTANDACGPATVTLRVRSDEDRRCHADDATVVDPHLVRLRAERRRSYTVTVEAVDANKNRASGRVTVDVSR
jgi:glucose/arabinose dehydrogenase